MKFLFLSLLLLSSPSVLLAQNPPAGGFVSQSLQRGTWEFAPFVGGGTGMGKGIKTQFLISGVRVGRILTGSIFHNWARGNFEYAADFMPIYLVFQPGGADYGASFKPIILKWNFTSHRKIAPYALIAGGVLFTSSNFPPGNTSRVNFSPQAAIGLHLFTRPHRAWDLEFEFVHHSNASLGTQNPGINASLFFTLGYSWFH